MTQSNNIFVYRIGSLLILTPFLFFALNSIFSIEYSGLSDSNSYVFTLVGVASFYLIFYMKNIFLSNVHYISDFVFYFLIVFVFLMLLYDFSSESLLNSTSIFQFGLMIIPVSLFALHFGKQEFPEIGFKYFFILCQIILISIITVIPKMLQIDVGNLSTFYGGGHYQGFGYIVSFSFLITLGYFLFLYTKKNFFKNLYFITSFSFHLAGAILSGARGSMIVIFVGSIFMLYLRFNLKKLIFLLVNIFFFIILSFNFLLFYLNSYTDRILESSDRIFSYLSKGTIDMSKTSNRDILYEESLKLIYKSPVFGYGFFDYLKQTGFGYPHNFFLEVLLQGGILYLIIWILVLFFFIYKLIILIRRNLKYVVILPFIFYSFILLLFSGTYLLEPFFWFSIIFVFTASSRKKVVIKRVV